MKSNNINDEFDKYFKKVDLVDYYITKNICDLIKSEQSYNFIMNNPILLSVVNKSNKNSLIILLENKYYDEVIHLIETNNDILKFKNYNENTLLNIMVQYNEMYNFINKIISEFDYNIVIELLQNKNKENMTFICIIIKLLNECENCQNNGIIEYDKIINIFTSIMNLNKEKEILLITTLCREIKKDWMLFEILNKIMKNTNLYSDEYLFNAIDYLLLRNNMKSLELLLQKAKKIKFCNFEYLSVFNYVEINDIDKIKKELILLIINKSNINKFKNKNNENLLEVLIKNNKFEMQELKKYFELFNFDKNNDNNKLAKKQIKFNSKIPSLKTILIKVELNNFLSNPINNMLYTLHILKKYNNVTIPYKIRTKSEEVKNTMLIEISGMDYLLYSYLSVYNDNYSYFTPHLIMWKNKWNYFIDKDLIVFLENIIKSPRSNKRFILIKLSIVLFDNSNVRHANYLIIDNKKKIVERFEPYGDIEIDNSIELNAMIEKNICEKINYKFEFAQLYPGFQIKSDELNAFNRNIGDPAGYCLAWCFMYIEVKLMYSDENTVKLIDNYINKKFTDDFKSVDSKMNKYIYFIRYYSKYLDENRNKLLNSFGIKNYYKKELKQNEEKNIIKEINKNLIKILE